MAGVGFELKKIFKNDGGFFNSLKGYSITAVVTEGPMVLTMIMLFMLRYTMKIFHGSYRDREIFLFIITYVMIFSLIFSNTILMFVNRFISDCIYKDDMKSILPTFYGIVVILLGFGDVIAILYLLTLPVTWAFRIAALLQFSSMLVLWVQIAFLSAVKKYEQVLLGFLAGTILSIGSALAGMALGGDPLMCAMWGASVGFLAMMLLFMAQMLNAYPGGRYELFTFLRALDDYKVLVVIGFTSAVGLYGHNFVNWCSSYRNKVFPTGVYCTKYDIPSFFAAMTILPLLIQFVVSLEVNFSVKLRRYFDMILYGGRWKDIQAAKKDMEKVLYRELAHMMEIQVICSVLAVTFLGNVLQKVGLDQEMAGIYRVLCFGYCLYGFVKSMIIVLLYFDDREGACKASVLFMSTSIGFTILTLFAGTQFWGAGFLVAGIAASVYVMGRLKEYLKHLEYHVFCRQPLFVVEENGVFRRMEERIEAREKEFRKRGEERGKQEKK